MTYTVSEMAEILKLTRANVAWRLNRLNLKSPHDESHLEAVRTYLESSKPLTLWQMVRAKYEDTDSATAHYQSYSYRWRKLNKPDIKSLDELDNLWNERISERKEHAKEYKEYSRHICSSASFVKKRTRKLRHMYDWYQFDSKGVWDDEVREWYNWYLDSEFKPCQARRLAYLEVLRQHHILDQDEYFEFKESHTKLKMAFQ